MGTEHRRPPASYAYFLIATAAPRQLKAVLAVTVVAITLLNALVMRWRPMTEDELAWYEGHHLPGKVELAVELDEELEEEIGEYEHAHPSPKHGGGGDVQVTPVMPAR